MKYAYIYFLIFFIFFVSIFHNSSCTPVMAFDNKIGVWYDDKRQNVRGIEINGISGNDGLQGSVLHLYKKHSLRGDIKAAGN